MRNNQMVGIGIRLTPKEYRRLEELAENTGRKPAGVVRRLIRMSSPRDEEVLAKLRGVFCIDEQEAFNDSRS